MRARKRSDVGQAFPIYIVMVAGLLFLAFAFFAVGKASATRNGAQGAADAAALAAAQQARDEIGPLFLGAILLPGGLNDFFGGHDIGGEPCGQASRFAGENRADLTACTWDSGFQRDEVTVEVKTRDTVGDTVIPGTETKHATAKATAVIEFRCTWKPAEEPDKDTGPQQDEDEGDKEENPGPITFECDGRDRFDIDPLHPDPWAELGKTLFAVHLIDD
ncbi:MULTISPECIES: pilus assembly protein TadG-related protein [Streptomyces]|uniref:pilus assembly protein TadG-related protein n=1 Tax=Streptomyces TaxID=1883 RepID=UPI0029A112ED|nr:pilus assembly protein TadG-related protein [Streptomyces sp. ND04-05B]MDX3066546.1 pilus assembly protein TadG-related protein [Streptomyces sp. ND04-05B]